MKQALSSRSRFLQVQMDFTTRCNPHCVMCAREQYPPANHDMPLASFQRIGGQLFDKAAVLTLSCGAEPLMSPHFAEALDIVKRYQIPRVEFVTNGTLLNERLIHKIIESDVTTVEVSIDGAQADTYERIRQGAKFDRVLQNLETLQSLKASHQTRRPYVKLNSVMMRRNIEELPGFVDMASRLGATEVAPLHLVVYEAAQTQGGVALWVPGTGGRDDPACAAGGPQVRLDLPHAASVPRRAQPVPQDVAADAVRCGCLPALWLAPDCRAGHQAGTTQACDRPDGLLHAVGIRARQPSRGSVALQRVV